MMLNYSPINRCQGAVLVVSLLLLMVITILGIAGLSNTTFEERMASNAQFMERAFQAANSEIENKLDEFRDDISPLIAALPPASGPQTLSESYSEANLTKAVTLTFIQQGVAPGYSIGKVIGLYFQLNAQANMTSVGAASNQTQGIMRAAPKGL